MLLCSAHLDIVSYNRDILEVQGCVNLVHHLDIVSYNGDILESNNNNNNNNDCLIIIIMNYNFFPQLFQAFDYYVQVCCQICSVVTFSLVLLVMRAL